MTHDNRGEHQVIDKAVSATADRGAMLLWLINDIAFLSMLFLEIAGVMTANATSLSIMTLLALGTCVSGVQAQCC
jgi:hypothetical protein